jgi:hypothetical protein
MAAVCIHVVSLSRPIVALGICSGTHSILAGGIMLASGQAPAHDCGIEILCGEQSVPETEFEIDERG